MKVESLVQLAGDGNTAAVEEQWMSLIESPDLTLSAFVEYKEVLAELCRRNRHEDARALAWAAIESLSTRFSALEMLTVAGPFLLALGEGDDLRAQVSDLYRCAYTDQEGLEELLTEAGLPKGRPVRRALRTLEVCLKIKEGDYLTSRDEDGAARVESVDIPAWKYSISTKEGTESLGAVHLADRYQPTVATDFRVLKQFDSNRLIERVKKNPTAIIIEICQLQGDKIDSDKLRDILVPHVMSEADWKRWWPRARTALKNSTHIKLEGRSPYTITYVEQAISFEDRMLVEFAAHRDPNARFKIVEQYLHHCKSRNESPSASTMRSCYDYFFALAKKREKSGSSQAIFLWTITRFIGDIAGIEEGKRGIIQCLRAGKDAGKGIKNMEDDNLLRLACESLMEAEPEDWPERFLTLLPDLPAEVCNWAASKLLAEGKSSSDIEPVIQQVLASPVSHFEALLWLWDGPTDESLRTRVALLTILTRILRALDQCRIDDKIPKDTVRKIYSRVRTVLSARKYERFLQCIENIDAGMAGALRTQISRLDGLGITVREDMINHILDLYPPIETGVKKTPIWAQENTVYVTLKGMNRRQEKIDHHVNVKMRENAKAIGAAAEKGDLSENSEYKFALEERDLLQARLIQMNNEMACARVIVPEEVTTEHISIGTKVVLERESDGRRYEMTFLGPWEADLECACFNYQSPLAQRLMGKKISDVVEFDHTGAKGTYKIIKLHNALVD